MSDFSDSQRRAWNNDGMDPDWRPAPSTVSETINSEMGKSVPKLPPMKVWRIIKSFLSVNHTTNISMAIEEATTDTFTGEESYRVIEKKYFDEVKKTHDANIRAVEILGETLAKVQKERDQFQHTGMSAHEAHCERYHKLLKEYEDLNQAGQQIDLDHPCKETCSGWKQGYDKGIGDGITNLVSALNKLLEPELMELIEKSIVRKGFEAGAYEIFGDCKGKSNER